MEDPVLDTSPALRKAFACLRDKYGMSEDSSPLDILGRVASELGGSLRQPTGAITWASQAIPQDVSDAWPSSSGDSDTEETPYSTSCSDSMLPAPLGASAAHSSDSGADFVEESTEGDCSDFSDDHDRTFYERVQHNKNRKVWRPPPPPHNVTQPLARADARSSFEGDWRSATDPKDCVKWLAHPFDEDDVHRALSKPYPVHIQRPNLPDYYSDLYSSKDIRAYLASGQCQYSYNVDVVRYDGSKRMSYNMNDPGPRPGSAPGTPAKLGRVWKRFEKEGCSVRILHPQQHCDKLWALMSRLETAFGCCVGCNAYLTPPGSQGFAPHYDDIDAFILQLEGRKRWSLYVDPNNLLPLHNRADFDRASLPAPCMEVVLGPGDLLILPRGTIHEGRSLPDTHSLHITLSANQGCSWAALLQAALPGALQEAAQRTLALRRPMGPDFRRLGCHTALEWYASASYSHRAASHIQGEWELPGLLERRLRRMFKHFTDAVWAHIHIAAEEQWEGFMAERLPQYPPLPRPGSVPHTKLHPGSRLSPVAQPGALRFTRPEPGVIRVVHGLFNDRATHARGEAAQEGAGTAGTALDFELRQAGVLAKALLRKDPEAHSVAEIQAMCKGHTEGGEVLQVLQALVAAGLLRVLDPGAQSPKPGRQKRARRADEGAAGGRRHGTGRAGA
ncbi:hypothetical protein ACKKBG_A28535 [Auxenochlorella protothecoides x Auxenochlorella symbiontica]